MSRTEKIWFDFISIIMVMIGAITIGIWWTGMIWFCIALAGHIMWHNSPLRPEKEKD